MLAIRTILHPTDFSENSGYALDFACGLASDYGASLVIIHVLAAPVALHPTTGLAVARERLEDLDISDHAIDVTRQITKGNPATQILDMAQMCRADMIVMGSHGRHAQDQQMVGSVLEAVLRKSTCPVLTVTAKPVARAKREEALVSAMCW